MRRWVGILQVIESMHTKGSGKQNYVSYNQTGIGIFSINMPITGIIMLYEHIKHLHIQFTGAEKLKTITKDTKYSP